MWLRKAVRLPLSLFGTVTVLSLTAVAFPVWVLSSALRKSDRSKPESRKRRRRLMPEVYDAKEVADMLKMVQAAMQHKSQQLLHERTASVELQQQVDTLRESLENMSYLFAQEQQHRLSLQAELDTAESAASDLRQMLAMYFGDSPSCSPDSTSTRYQSPMRGGNDTTWQAASPSHLHSGLPGTLDRRDSRLQMDLAGIQKRLHKIAQLRDTPPSSPRSADRISAWASPSTGDVASPKSGTLGRSRTFASRLSPVKHSPLRATTMNLGHLHDHDAADQDDEAQAEPHARFADDPPEPAEQVNQLHGPDDAEQEAGKADSSPQQPSSRLDDAVSLDSRTTASQS